MVTGKLQIARQRIMNTLNDYRAVFNCMEIVEDKDEGGFMVSYPDLPAQREGISMNQYCVYLLSRNDAVHSK